METLDVKDWELEYDNTERDPDVLELEEEVQAASGYDLFSTGARSCRECRISTTGSRRKLRRDTSENELKTRN